MTFNDKSGTNFEYSRIPLNEGLFIMYLSGCLNVPTPIPPIHTPIPTPTYNRQRTAVDTPNTTRPPNLPQKPSSTGLRNKYR